MSEPIIQASGLRYRYAGAAGDALRELSFEIKPGEFVLLAADSGGGKSTLLRAISGLVPHFYGGLAGGELSVCGLDFRDAGPAELSRYVSTVFQDPEAQVLMNGVRAELSLPLENRGAEPAAIARAVEEAALALGVAGLLDRSVDTLSGGELQRVALATALVTKPRLLVLDEPTSQLDPVAGDELVWQLRRLNEEWGTTIVLAEQRLERCLPAADRVLAMQAGSIEFDGSPGGFVEWAVRRDQGVLPPVAQMFADVRLRPLPATVKSAKGLLRARAIEPTASKPLEADSVVRNGSTDPARAPEPIAATKGLWVEYEDGSASGHAALRDLHFDVTSGSVTALLGRNGAGKSTLLSTLSALLGPSRGTVSAPSDFALVLQNPNAYLLRERVRDELPPVHAEAAMVELGLDHLADRDPRDLSGGERQRLALAIVLAGRGVGGGKPPALVMLDEPTRGLDRHWKRKLASVLRDFASAGSAAIVATHDIEFAAAIADRCVLLAEGNVVADAPPVELLIDGSYFTTDVARVLGPGAGCLLPEQGASWLKRRLASDTRAKTGREEALTQ